MKQVAFITAILPHYRAGFHSRVREKLLDHGISYNLHYGQPTHEELAKGDLIDLPWALPVKNKYFGVTNSAPIWQPLISTAKNADLTIIGQENRLLINYPLQIARRHLKGRLALWGHGKNHQLDASTNSLRERWKRYWLRESDWWFAYTDRVADYVESCGFPRKRITSFHNAVDVAELKGMIPPHVARDAVRKKFNIPPGPIGIFIGGIYPHKRMEFLLKACSLLKKLVPDFQLIIVGSGISMTSVSENADSSWVHMMGPRFGRDKAELMSISDLFLMPGLVGLAVLDAAAANLPLVTTAYPFHSPEIEYLEECDTGLVVDNWTTPSAYAESIFDLLNDGARRARYAVNGEKLVEKYNIENMASRFSSGVLEALASPKR